MLFKLAWRNIWRNKKRTYITMASIVFAVLLSILLNSLKEGILFRMQENVVSFYTGAVQVHQSGYWEEQTLEYSFENTPDLIKSLEKHHGVKAAIPRLESFALAATDQATKACMVIGIDVEREPIVTAVDSKLIIGKYLTSEDRSVLVAEGLANYLELTIGDTLVMLGQGYHGVSAAGKYPIKGVLKFASPELNRRMVYLPINHAQELYGAHNRLTALVLKIDNVDQAEDIRDDLNALVDSSYEVMDWKTMLPELNQVLEGERAENVIFMVVLYLLIAFGIFGTVLMMTLERQYEFGVLVAIGMRRLWLSVVVIVENIFISFLGAILGTLLSVPIVAYFYHYPIRVTGELEKMYEDFGFEPIFYFSIAPEIFYSQTIIVLCMALVISVYPFFKLLNLEPVAAMRA